MVVALRREEGRAVNFLLVGTDFPPLIGGISTYAKELAIALSRRGSVTVLAPGARNFKYYDSDYPFRVIRTPAFPLLRDIAFLIYLPVLIRRYRIEVVIHTIWLTALISHLFCRFLPTPYFVSVHASEILDDTRTWRRRIKGYLKRWRICALKNARGLFPVSRFSAKIVSSIGIAKKRICVIPNGVDPQRFRFEAPHPGVNKVLKLLTVARLDLHKGHDIVLEAIAILKKEGLTLNYIVAGQGEEELRLRDKVRMLGLQNQVEFAGFIPDSELPDVYAEADIFVMASRQIPGRLDLIEGFGIALLEASASGLPVVAGDSGGIGDAVRDGKTGFLVNPNKPEEIARVIKFLLDDVDRARQLGEEGRRWVETQMSWECVAEKMCSAIHALK